MFFNERILVIANLTLQLTLAVALLTAAYFAKIKRNYARHCLILRFAVPLQIIAVIFVMSASMARHLQVTGAGLIQAEILLHHSLGLVVIGLWVFANLAFEGIVKFRGRLVIVMRTAFVAWALALVIGLHLYSVLWL